jgi:dihydroflavonol-4-reductase
MKVFVTGSTGLLGNNLVHALEAAGHSVVGLVRAEEKGRRLLSDTRHRSRPAPAPAEARAGQ